MGFHIGLAKKIIGIYKIGIEACTTAEFPTRAKQPAYSLLSKEKVKNTFGVTVPGWEESLDKFISSINSKDTIEKRVKSTRNEDSVSFEEYLNNIGRS